MVGLDTGYCDVLIIGAGIAGVSAAYELAASRKVVLVEQEAQPAFHSTGRSAALFSAIYGAPSVRALSRASRHFFEQPPVGFASHALLERRGMLFYAPPTQLSSLEELELSEKKSAALRRLNRQQTIETIPVFRPDHIGASLLEADAADIDVHSLHQGYLRGFRSRGGKLVSDCRVVGLTQTGCGWRAETAVGTWHAEVVVNAGGAWGDQIASSAGVAPIGLSPRLRTAVLVDAPSDPGFPSWPLAISIDETLYFKPDAGKLLVSPADEGIADPCDAQPDEYDVAVAIDRLETTTSIQVGRVSHRWAGLRTFSPDRVPVAGFDASSKGFFWLVGQGGYGIQTAPALARLTSSLIVSGVVPDDLQMENINLATFSPDRFSAVGEAPLAVDA